MAHVKNIAQGDRGIRSADGHLTMVPPGVIVELEEGDDVNEEWFEPCDPLDHDGDGKKGGSKKKADSAE